MCCRSGAGAWSHPDRVRTDDHPEDTHVEWIDHLDGITWDDALDG
jgi:hypothetical protein